MYLTTTTNAMNQVTGQSILVPRNCSCKYESDIKGKKQVRKKKTGK